MSMLPKGKTHYLPSAQKQLTYRATAIIILGRRYKALNSVNMQITNKMKCRRNKQFKRMRFVS